MQFIEFCTESKTHVTVVYLLVVYLVINRQTGS